MSSVTRQELIAFLAGNADVALTERIRDLWSRGDESLRRLFAAFDNGLSVFTDEAQQEALCGRLIAETTEEASSAPTELPARPKPPGPTTTSGEPSGRTLSPRGAAIPKATSAGWSPAGLPAESLSSMTQSAGSHQFPPVPSAAMLWQAKGEDAPGMEARRELAMLYYGAAYRYALGYLHKQDVAQDLATEFAVRLMEGRYVKVADPSKGRFGDYLKRSLQNLVHDYMRQMQKTESLSEHSGMTNEPTSESDADFVASLREELVSRTWKALGVHEKETQTPYETVLRLKTQQPNLRAAEIAAQLSEQMGKPFNEQGVRKILKRARDKFTDLLVEHVQNLLQVHETDSLEEQLVELGLLDLCRDALRRRKTP
jgi:RNA polymerase sigma factor (sigma-70 family)